jgi:thioredoxin reductase (NADPH)
MGMLLTTVGFFLLTALFIALHMRKEAPAPAASAGTDAIKAGRPCPRCSSAVPAGGTFCPECGVPQQVFEVVAAPVVESGASGDGVTDGATPVQHAVVRSDLCVGCSTCADACPEEGALIMDGKLAIVDKQSCTGHSDCVDACPVGGIFMSTGAAVHRVQTPDVGTDFQSNVPGLYVVGELGGRGLIKNAINEGKLAVEEILRRHDQQGASSIEGDSAAGGGNPVSGPVDILDVAIVGSGPAGLSAGLEAKRCGLSYVILEQGSVADTIRKYPRKKILLAEPVKVPLYGDLWISDSSKETLIDVWETIIANTGLEVRSQHRVENITRQGELFILRAGGKEFLARAVVLAMGRRGTPRRLGVPGEDLDKVYYDIVEMEAFKGRKVLVVGGGDSAVESALGLANQEGTEVFLSYRGDQFKRVKERNQAKLDAGISAGRIHPLLGSQVREIKVGEVELEMAGTSRRLANDDVVIRIGGEAPFGFLEKIGINIVEKDVPLPDAQASAS